MKFRTIVFLFIIVIFAIAGFTKPGYESFMKFREETDRGQPSPPVIEYKNGFIYSVFTISHFDIRQVKDAKANDGNSSIAIPVKKEKYLGLFGRFWSLD